MTDDRKNETARLLSRMAGDKRTAAERINSQKRRAILEKMNKSILLRYMIRRRHRPNVEELDRKIAEVEEQIRRIKEKDLVRREDITEDEYIIDLDELYRP